jgi:hypothetical protein
MRISAHGFSGRSVYLALVASLGLACNDNPASPSNKQLAVPTGISASVSDPGLNYNDTWVSSTEVVADTTTINSNDPFTDPMKATHGRDGDFGEFTAIHIATTIRPAAAPLL